MPLLRRFLSVPFFWFPSRIKYIFFKPLHKSYLTLPDARMVFDFAYISPLLTFFAQSVNLLIVNVGLSQCRAIA